MASEPAVYDPANTPADVGPFPEYFRRQPGVVRSRDPMVSVSGLGPAAAALFADLPPTSYGADSVFARLTLTRAKCCNIGLGPNWTPFIHHADWLRQVPFRHDKLFTGLTIVGGRLERLSWVYAVRIAAAESRADAHRLGKMATDHGIWHFAPLGRARIYTADYREYFDFAMERMRDDPWLMAVGPPVDPLAREKERVGIERFSATLPPTAAPAEIAGTLGALRHDVVSDGMDAVLSSVADLVPLTIHAYRTGTHCLDWIVPEKWTCRRAELRDMAGKVVFSTDDNPLHAASYSLPFNGEVSREQLLRHLHSHPRDPEAVPFRQDFTDRDWALCCSHETRAALTDERYRVTIDADYSYGRLKVGEVVVPGQRSESVLLCCHLDHPMQINAGLSGMLAGLEVIKAGRKRHKPQLTLRLLLLPGPIGLAAWLSRHQALVPKLVGGLTLRMMARRLPYMLQLSEAGNTQMDRICQRILTDMDIDRNGQIVTARRAFDEFPSGGNPLFVGTAPPHFPMLTLARALPLNDPAFPSRGHNSDKDDLGAADFTALTESSQLVLAMLEALDAFVAGQT
jgi:aminopeptidase-like protein/aminoglycoside N3'-acetyltransferase